MKKPCFVKGKKRLAAENLFLRNNPANIYLFIVHNRNIRERCEICSKLTIETSELRH